MAWLDQEAKYVIEVIARGVEFAAAVVIGLAAIEASVKAAIIFLRRSTPCGGPQFLDTKGGLS
jgi:hypothetical protein